MSLSTFLHHPCCFIPTRLSGWGSHLLALDSFRSVVLRGEFSAHNVLKMKAVVLALVVFLPQLLGQSVVLMSNNATIDTYLRNQGGSYSVSCPVSHGRRVSALDRVLFGLPDAQVYSREEECSGGPGSSQGMVASSEGLEGICGVFGRPRLDLWQDFFPFPPARVCQDYKLEGVSSL